MIAATDEQRLDASAARFREVGVGDDFRACLARLGLAGLAIDRWGHEEAARGTSQDHVLAAVLIHSAAEMASAAACCGVTPGAVGALLEQWTREFHAVHRQLAAELAKESGR